MNSPFHTLAKTLAKRSNTPSSPDPLIIRAAREQSGLTQEDAGALVYAARRSWQDWELGNRPMHPATWELFLIKSGHKGE